MKNIYKIIWTEEALSGLKDIFKYLEVKFSEKEIQKFAKKLDGNINVLKKSPLTFPVLPNSIKVR